MSNEQRTCMSRRDFLRAAGIGAAALTLGSLFANAAAVAARKKPNIVIIVADDLGYGELSIQGCKDLKTPNIDSIAHSGIRFTNGYVSCPVCSPTRAGLMTGRYGPRFGYELNPGMPGQAADNFGLPLNEKTLAERLKPLGYKTAIFGKWHLGYEPQFQPQKRGFDEFFGFLGGAHGYLNPETAGANPIMRGTKPVEKIQYTTEDFAREAASFIQRHKDVPFFLYLPFNAVHSPLQATEKYLSRFTNIKDHKRRTFLAMQSAMDDGVGRVLAKLRELKLEEDTIVFFISDNGGPTLSTTSGNGPLRGYKGQVLEGGIRIPFMVQWKGHIPAGQVSSTPVIALDIHPTALIAAGGKVTPEMKLDGANIMPLLTGKKKTAPHDVLFWRYGQQWAIRKGDWKLESNGTGPAELYNLTNDIGEATNLAEKRPEKAKELQADYNAWNAQLVPPKWSKQKVRKRNKGGKGGVRALLGDIENDNE